MGNAPCHSVSRCHERRTQKQPWWWSRLQQPRWGSQTRTVLPSPLLPFLAQTQKPRTSFPCGYLIFQSFDKTKKRWKTQSSPRCRAHRRQLMIKSGFGGLCCAKIWDRINKEFKNSLMGCHEAVGYNGPHNTISPQDHAMYVFITFRRSHEKSIRINCKEQKKDQFLYFA